MPSLKARKVENESEKLITLVSRFHKTGKVYTKFWQDFKFSKVAPLVESVQV